MRERIIEITTKAGRMEMFTTCPEQGGPFPAVMIFMDVWGVREELFDIARRVATVGYYVLVPDFYYRQGKVRSTYINAEGKRISLNKLSKEDQAKVTARSAATSDAMIVDDVGAVIEHLKSSGEPGRSDAMGSIGYCMGGRHVQVAGTHYPRSFKASASLHGTYLISDKPDSSHQKIGEMCGEYYCGFAEVDHYAPPEMIEKLGTLAKANTQLRYTEVVHPGTVHGYALPDRDIFHKQAAERDWELIFAMFHRQIPPAFAG